MTTRCRYCDAGYKLTGELKNEHWLHQPGYRTGIRIITCKAAFHGCKLCGAGPCRYGLKNMDDCTVEKRP